MCFVHESRDFGREAHWTYLKSELRKLIRYPRVKFTELI